MSPEMRQEMVKNRVVSQRAKRKLAKTLSPRFEQAESWHFCYSSLVCGFKPVALREGSANLHVGILWANRRILLVAQCL